MKISEMRNTLQNLPTSQAFMDSSEAQELLRRSGIDPHNFYQELEMESPYVNTHRDISVAGSNMQFHSHAFYEILCCRNSCGAEYLMGPERYKLQRGDVILIPPNVGHMAILPQPMPEPYLRDVLWISEDFFQNVAAHLPDLSQDAFSRPMLLRTAGTRWEYLAELFHHGVRESESAEPGWETLVIANTMTILIHLRRCMEDPQAKPLVAEKPDLLNQVLAYMEQHLSEKISLAEVARQFFVSESTITQTFRKRMGISFYRCVTQRRLIAAKALIDQGISLDAVAESVGFSDYSSFFRAFKQEYGISPRQYRKLQTESK